MAINGNQRQSTGNQRAIKGQSIAISEYGVHLRAGSLVEEDAAQQQPPRTIPQQLLEQAVRRVRRAPRVRAVVITCMLLEQAVRRVRRAPRVRAVVITCMLLEQAVRRVRRAPRRP